MEYLNKSTKNIEIKNEQNLRTIDFKMLEEYSKLGEVNFSMNNLSEFSMTGKKDFPNLIELRLSQNKIN
jgi:Leucine-rich repeat (LRR) protein